MDSVAIQFVVQLGILLNVKGGTIKIHVIIISTNWNSPGLLTTLIMGLLHHQSSFPCLPIPQGIKPGLDFRESGFIFLSFYQLNDI